MEVQIFVYIFFLLTGIFGNLNVAILLFLTFKKFSTKILKRSIFALSIGLFLLFLSLLLYFIDYILSFKLQNILIFQLFLLALQILNTSLFIYSSVNLYFLAKEIGFEELEKLEKVKKIIKS